MNKALSKLKRGQHGEVVRIVGEAELKKRLAAMGFLTGVKVVVEHSTLLGDPKTYSVSGCLISMRAAEAKNIIVEC